MKIAVVSNTYKQGKSFIESKYRDKIASIKVTAGEYTLKDGNIVVNCYDDTHSEAYTSYSYDAYIVNPLYQTLEDVIKGRCIRS